MVECEFESALSEALQDNGFNRYMVECECPDSVYNYVNMYVLIDTWWNVNLPPSRLLLLSLFVLIDTWWNVNTHQTKMLSVGRVF